MTVKPREELKAVHRNDYKVHILKTIFLVFITPVVVVQTVSLIFNFSWMNAIALAAIIIGTNAIDIILTHIYDGRTWKQILGYFRDFNDCLFELTTIDIKTKI